MSRPDYPRESLLDLVALSALRPTQVTVGMGEVEERRLRWRDVKDKKEFLARHLVPVLLGPNGHRYVLDHHHLARALLDEGVTKVTVTAIADLSHLSKPAFWIFLDNRGWCHPYGASGSASARSRAASPISLTIHSAACLARHGGGAVSPRL